MFGLDGSNWNTISSMPLMLLSLCTFCGRSIPNDGTDEAELSFLPSTSDVLATYKDL